MLHAGTRRIGCILTGMVRNGADGLARLRAAGGICFTQDGESAVVDGMPRADRENGAAQQPPRSPPTAPPSTTCSRSYRCMRARGSGTCPCGAPSPRTSCRR
ncbi:chemotaxis protein CheB [Conexibacter sp. DBS9H8]|uniref:chemotaxis protein CheB n=1 Tax=Conexibacter sp. DBS9H8 TaxID=2937801 RepID=UPI0035311A1A